MTTAALPDHGKLRELHFQEGDQIRLLETQNLDYFTVFGLPPRLVLDVEALRDVFLDLSRRFHPDYFATAEERLREESLRRSSLLNNAYKTLRDPQRRAEYLITHHGLGIESNKNAVPPELLEEMFEIQEAGEDLREARLSANEDALGQAEVRVAPLRKDVQAAREKLQQQLEQEFAAFDEAAINGIDREESQNALSNIRLTLDRMNYLRTVLRNLK